MNIFKKTILFWLINWKSTKYVIVVFPKIIKIIVRKTNAEITTVNKIESNWCLIIDSFSLMW